MSRMPFSIHSFLRQARVTLQGASRPHGSSTRGISKEYPRFERLTLPEPAEIPVSLADALATRTSELGNITDRPLTLGTLGTLLGLSMRARADNKRPYPSGGALFPIEAYVLGRLEKRTTAAYHYHPGSHALEYLWDIEDRIDTLIRHEAAPIVPVCVVLTGTWGRVSSEYGDFGYLLGILEAGHIAQNLLLAAAALKMAARPLEGFDDERISEVLDLKETTEQAVYAIALATRP